MISKENLKIKKATDCIKSVAFCIPKQYKILNVYI